MFESLEVLDRAATAASVAALRADTLRNECRVFALAAHWADLHHPDSRPAPTTVVPGGEQTRRLGGDGTPPVLEFCPAELAGRLATTVGAASSLIADALDCRHRLPTLWDLVQGGGIEVWRVRKVAQATRRLSVPAARMVDGWAARGIGVLPWARFDTLLAAKIVEADPLQAEQERQWWEAERYVRAGRTRDGLRTVVTRALAGDVLVYLATVDRIAEILAVRGDLDPAEVRRSKAVGILAQPARALQLLYDHRDDTPDPARPGDPVDRSEGPDNPDPQPIGNIDPAAGLVIVPPSVDPAEVRPRLVLYVHLSAEAVSTAAQGGVCGVARLEQAGPLTLGQVRRWLAGTACDIRVQPVIDLNDTPAPVDGYEIPDRMRAHLQLRQPASAYPYSPHLSRRRDLDHTIAYLTPDRGGPPGQTRIGNLDPLTRREHRLRTHGRWRVRQATPGTTVWRSPLGACYLTTPAGTLALGTTPFADAVWTAARPHAPARPPTGDGAPTAADLV